MRCICIVLAFAWCVRSETGETTQATPRPPLRTLDRQAAELAWRSWLQSAESRDPAAPPRRITTKSLFITPLICPKGQRLDRDGCAQVVTVSKDDHERYLLEQLNALFTSSPGDDILYDYGDDEPGPLQLSIPIGLEPQSAPLQGLDPLAQAQAESKPNYVQVNNKDERPTNEDLSLEAELELLKLEKTQIINNATSEKDKPLENHVFHNVLVYSDKPKRDSAIVNSTSNETSHNSSDEGQKELVFGNVNVDPILYITEPVKREFNETNIAATNNITDNNNLHENNNGTVTVDIPVKSNTIENKSNVTSNKTVNLDKDNTKLKPENDYTNIGEAIKLISRYAEVTTDDNFSKNEKKHALTDDGILGTRTKLQHRRNKLKSLEGTPQLNTETPFQMKPSEDKTMAQRVNPNSEIYYRYPWSGQHYPTPPPNYPFRHLQDYWPDRRHIGGVYNSPHENPRRHHHSYPHTNSRPHNYPDFVGYPSPHQDGQLYIGHSPHRLVPRRVNAVRGHPNNQDLYSLLGLRHWFSSESSAKR